MGSAYTTIISDVMARYGHLMGAEVHFVTGMDEHGEKIARTASGKELEPQELVDLHAKDFEDLWEKLSVRTDHFVRTTSATHKAIVNEFWQRCVDQGDIYEKDYEGYYCVGCEAYLDKDDFLEGDGHICKIHRTPCELRSEKNYFFRLSKYWDQVKSLVESNEDFILPTSRRNEVLAWLSKEPRDFSISRTRTSWGIQVPDDEEQVIYVWFDALLGYISSLLQPDDPPTLEAALKRGWPADVHVTGKDILRFHAVYWPAMLLSAGLPLPRHICSHGFLTRDGVKMGKSLGNVLEPLPLVEKYGTNAVRFFFAACLPFGEDVDFNYKIFTGRLNHYLANSLGNLLQRLLTLARKNLEEPTAPDTIFQGGRAAAEEHPVYKVAIAAPERVRVAYEQMRFSSAAGKAMKIVDVANAHIMEVTPWTLLKGDDEDKKVALSEILLMLEGVRITTVLLRPIVPDLVEVILKEMDAVPAGGIDTLHWSDSEWRWQALAGACKDEKPTPIFQRLADEEEDGPKKKQPYKRKKGKKAKSKKAQK